MLVTSCECGENLVKSSEGNINSQTIYSNVVCCMGIYCDLGTIDCVGSNREVSNTKWHLRRDSDRERTAKFLRMEKLIADLDTQLKFLNFTRKKGQAIVEKRTQKGSNGIVMRFGRS